MIFQSVTICRKPIFIGSESISDMVGAQGMPVIFYFSLWTSFIFSLLLSCCHSLLLHSFCSSGSWDESDDLVFAVADGSTSAPVTSSPTKNPTLSVSEDNDFLF